ncbi:MAG TPA: type II toxin-antitoxin system PemK/MazF family toxin [Armatimonadota bacterium]|nr:type II toxin-antitoxin system PemK/MazF family toxin [Armatimonadota bacterium]
MKGGDLYWVELLSRGGHTQTGRRPALIAQAAAVSTAVPTVLIIPLTTQQDALRFPGTLLIEADQLNRLPRTSVALVFQLTAIDQRHLRERLGAVSAAVMGSVWQVFDEITDRHGPH